MKHCKYCNIDVDTSNDFCPLCFNHLEEVNSSYEQFYTPRLKNETADRKKHFITKLFLFLTICSIVICFFINFLTDFKIKWFLVVTFGIIYVWVLVAHTIMSTQSAFKKIFLQLISIIALLYFTEQVAEPHDWLLQYVYPSISFTVVAVICLILFIDKNRNDKILGFATIILLMGIGSLLFIIFKLSPFVLLNFINCILCGLTIIGILIFGNHAIKQELSKKLHL